MGGFWVHWWLTGIAECWLYWLEEVHFVRVDFRNVISVYISLDLLKNSLLLIDLATKTELLLPDLPDIELDPKRTPPKPVQIACDSGHINVYFPFRQCDFSCLLAG